jgi:DNA-binding beta-propeller fold protein YncE
MDSPETHNPTATPARPRRGSPRSIALVVVFAVAAACIIAFVALLLRPKTDSGIRVWILNHTPDQVVIINPFDQIVEKKFMVADGLRGLTFSRDNTKAYIYNVVDVTNRLNVIDTRTFLTEETIEVDGIPQGIGVFPDNRKLAVILGSKSTFEAGGFDVIDLYEQSRANPQKKKRLYRERGLAITHKIAVGDDGDKIYTIDAKSSKIYIYSFSQKELVSEIDLHGAPEELFYPRQGIYYYVSVLQHRAIYQLNKYTDELNGVFKYQLLDPENPYAGGRLRHIALDKDARYLLGTNSERDTVAVWDLQNLDRYNVPWEDVPYFPDRFPQSYRFEQDHYLPAKVFRLKGGYDPTHRFIPNPRQLEVGPTNEYLFVVDEYGAIYVYNFADVVSLTSNDTENPVVLEPRGIVVDIADQTTEVRDLAVSQPTVL